MRSATQLHPKDYSYGISAISAQTEYRADSWFAPSQWETALLCNDISHWLDANLELALEYYQGKAQLTKSNINLLKPITKF